MLFLKMKRILLGCFLIVFIATCEDGSTMSDEEKATFKVSGNVSSEEGFINGANLQLTNNEADTLFSTSDENGFYEFESVLEGLYSLKVNKDKFGEFVEASVAVDGADVEVNPELRLLSFPDSLISDIKVINPDSVIGNYKLNLNSSSDFDMEADLGTDSSQLATMTFRMSREILEGDIIQVTAIGDSKDIPGTGTEGRALVGIRVFNNLELGPAGTDAEFLFFFDRLESQNFISPSRGQYINIYASGTGAVNWDGSFFKLYSIVGK